MKNGITVLALDLGASSGRAIKGRYENGTLTYSEIHRFENNPGDFDGHFCWDFEALLGELKTGIAKAGEFDSVGVDTWGVDFGLIDKNGKLLARPVHYRDTRTDGIPEQIGNIMSKEELYRLTGNQIMPINTLFQLTALKRQQPELLQKAYKLLFMPDLFEYFLCGQAACERSIASTSQMLDPASGKWSKRVLKDFGIPESILGEPVPSGTVTGSLPGGAKVIAVAGHDTQCASAAVPNLNGGEAAFLSSGTWSLLGTETDRPVLTPESCSLGLSNELGANGKVNYLKNIIGLWLIQESRRSWRRQGHEYSYDDMERMARASDPLLCFIDPDAPEFSVPGDIPARVKNYCRETGQHIPQTDGEVMRCIYESLAMKYRCALEQLKRATGKKFGVLHIIGGGTKDALLSQLAADSTGLPVTAGPVEATALGNMIIQLSALGAIPDINAGRRLIAKSEKLKHYVPENTGICDEKYKTYLKILYKE
ncbi:MAG TPA: rhamnulokinase [Ruminococcaceae bacterium]|nr:rhamnulokinase [Oscillospiraceae bacterium]